MDNLLKEKQEELVREGFQWVKVDTRGVVGNIFDGVEKVGLVEFIITFICNLRQNA